ncbi:PAS domain-containing protein [Paraurantiacibacter namhicola]|uniref:histidine kinase n=1 Tax=Paraurantiacibacter namhicola TaxID=645517 RepID=A0A1C7D9V4_9SPHN|nr:PAS domain-containing protein [Paraurantiacibacter namhicola]ANU08279.1 Blue-light-activated histidine kinase 1 [Paraurantiacibacter namhicola]
MNREDPKNAKMRTDRPAQADVIPRHDAAPGQFRADHPGDSFSGSSGVLFEQAMAQTRMAICLTDPNQPDMPIVFANRAFRNLTGYEEEEIIGRNCRFLQGPDTDPEPIEKIRTAIETEDVTVVELLNYRKNGEPFWNALHLGPIYNDAGELLYFFGSQWDVSNVRAARAQEHTAREMARELSHRMKNLFSVITGIVNITGRTRGITAEAQEINERIQALGRAYETTLDEASTGFIELNTAIRSILAPHDPDGEHLTLDGNGLSVPFALISGIGLVLHELADNAKQHGAWSNGSGHVKVAWERQNGDSPPNVVIHWTETGGPPVTTQPDASGTGHIVMDRLIRISGGTIERDWHEDGLRARIEFPIGTKNR